MPGRGLVEGLALGCCAASTCARGLFQLEINMYKTDACARGLTQERSCKRSRLCLSNAHAQKSPCGAYGRVHQRCGGSPVDPSECPNKRALNFRESRVVTCAVRGLLERELPLAPRAEPSYRRAVAIYLPRLVTKPPVPSTHQGVVARLAFFSLRGLSLPNGHLKRGPGPQPKKVPRPKRGV